VIQAIRLLVATIVVLGMLLVVLAYAADAPVEKMSITEFKARQERDQVFMVVGAMAAAGWAGMRCPLVLTVGEMRAAILYRDWAQDQPWANVVFTVYRERQCTVASPEKGEKPNA